MPMKIRLPTLSVDDQDYYPLHDERDPPGPAEREYQLRYIRDVLTSCFPEWFIAVAVPIHWEEDNVDDGLAPDVFVVKAPLAEPVTRVYELGKQPPIAFVLEGIGRSVDQRGEGPKVAWHRESLRAAEHCLIDLDRREKQLWRLGPNGYQAVAPEWNGMLRSLELGLQLDLFDGSLRLYTSEGAMLLTHEEEARRRGAE
jgi:hypothetical protein